MTLIHIKINGESVTVAAHSSVAAALAGRPNRLSVGEAAPRAAFCGMGVCFECRVTIDGQSQQRACQVLVREGMEILCDA